MAKLTEAQKNSIEARRRGLRDMQGVIEAMNSLLQAVELEVYDSTEASDNRGNPWLIGDATLSVAIAKWNEYKTNLSTKLTAIP